MGVKDVEMWFVEYSVDGVGVEYPQRGYVTQWEAEEFVDELPYEQQMSATIQSYNPFED